MIRTLLQEFSPRIHDLLAMLQGFAETGHLGIDSVAFKTRDDLKDLGIL